MTEKQRKIRRVLKAITKLALIVIVLTGATHFANYVHYKEIVDVLQKNPSEKWGKFIVLKDYEPWEDVDDLDIVETESNVYVLSLNEDKSDLFKLDKEGTILKKNELELGKHVKDPVLIKSRDGASLAWSSYREDGRVISIADIDEDLSLEKKAVFNGYSKVSKISGSTILISEENKFIIYDVSDENTKPYSLENSYNFVGAQFNGKYYIVYQDKIEGKHICRIYRDDKLEKEIVMGHGVVQVGRTMKDQVLLVNDERISLVYESVFGKDSLGIEYMNYNMINGERCKGELRYDEKKFADFTRGDDQSIIGITNYKLDQRIEAANAFQFNISYDGPEGFIRLSDSITDVKKARVGVKYAVYADNKLRVTGVKDTLQIPKESIESGNRDNALVILSKVKKMTTSYMISLVLKLMGPIIFIFIIVFFCDHKIKSFFRYILIPITSIIYIFYEYITLNRSINFREGFDGLQSNDMLLLICTISMTIVVLLSMIQYVKKTEKLPLGNYLVWTFVQGVVLGTFFLPFIAV